MTRPSDYLITPGDVWEWTHSLTVRDWLGLGLMAASALVVGWRLDDPGAGLFAAGLVLALWWRVDSRWPFGAALVLLVLIPIMQIAYDHNWLFSGGNIASGLAVAVWYLLAIGVVRQLLELRSAPAAVTVAAPLAAAVGPPAAKPLPLPAWRQRLAAIEREAASGPGHKAALDGLRPKTAAQPRRTRRR